jgi:uncharacterized protein YgbK (DUF1537 family)
VVVVCGSKYPRALEQIEFAAALLNAPVMALDPYAPGAETARLTEPGPAVVMLAEGPAAPPESGPEEMLAEFLSRIIPILEAANPAGIGIIGGDTAFALMRRCGATALEVEGSVAEVVACGRVRDGMLGGRCFAVKGGSVGSDDAVVEMMRYLEG